MTKQLGFVFRAVNSFDRLGTSVASIGDINGDGVSDIVIGAPNVDDPNGSDAGAAYVVFGRAGGYAPDLTLAALDGTNGFLVTGGTAIRAHLGFSVSTAGDLNGDGLDDVIIGEPGGGIYNDGYVNIIYGSSAGFNAVVGTKNDPDTDTDFFRGWSRAASLGYSVAGGGDFNGDGVDDVISSSPDIKGDARLSGGVTISFGFSDLIESPGAVFISGLEEGDRFGRSVSYAGDVNGDGIDDMIVGTSPRSDFGEGSADAFVIFGTNALDTASFDLADLDGSNGFVIKTDEVASFNSVYGSSAGDVNGDGIDDIVVAHYRDNGESTNYVIFGTADGFDASLDVATLDGTNGFTLPTLSSYDRARSATSAGDVNGDGIDDLLIGAYSAGSSGETYILFGTTDGFDASYDLSTLDGTNGYTLQGVGLSERSGRSVASAGDVNADGTVDIIIGAPSFDAESTAHVVYGGADNLAALDLEDGTADGRIQLSFIDTAILDTADKDDLKGNDYRDRFVMRDDGQSDKVRDFDVGFDRFDMTDFGPLTFEDLTITNKLQSDGSISWIYISDQNSEREIQVQFDEGTALDAAALTANSFIFATTDTVERDPAFIIDTAARDDLRGTEAVEDFVMLDDGQSDIVRDFEVGVDKFDVTDLNASSIDELIISNLTRKDGSISWVAIHDASGQREMQVRFAGETPLDVSALGADDFVFSTKPSEPVEPHAIKLQDLDGRNKLRGTDAEEEFVMLNDGQSDIVFNFDVGVDTFEVTALDAQSFDDLTITNLYRADGSVSWVSIADTAGEREMQVRFAGDIALDATALSADDFLFG